MSNTFRLVRSRRRTLSVHIASDCVVEVRAPLRLPQSRIDEFLHEKQAWIERQLTLAREREAQRMAFAPTALLLEGREYPIQYGKRAGFDGTCFTLPVGSWDATRPAAVALYRKLARERIGARLVQWGAVMGTTPTGWGISSAAKRWGSCSGKNKLSFSWRLVLAPPEAIDYVVVHELAHILHHNHSAAFWGSVAHVLPDYPHSEALLRTLQERLLRERWV